jgi:hypothetical protein
MHEIRERVYAAASAARIAKARVDIQRLKGLAAQMQ